MYNVFNTNVRYPTETTPICYDTVVDSVAIVPILKIFNWNVKTTKRRAVNVTGTDCPKHIYNVLKNAFLIGR